MKKVICFMITLTLIFSSVSIAYAKQGGSHDQKSHGAQKTVKQETIHASGNVYSKTQTIISNSKLDNKTKNASSKCKAYGKKQTFKIDGAPVIKYGKYKVPIRPITKGMGATLDFNKTTGVLTVTKDTTTIVINLKDKSVTVNGVADLNSGIFNSKNDKKCIVLIKYIADKLGVRITLGKDKISTEVPDSDNDDDNTHNQKYVVTVTPVGTTGVANTINTTTQYLTATAAIPVGKAIGGKAELYVGSTLVAVDTTIVTGDTSVNFTTSDTTPTSAELQALIPTGGAVTVKLYSAAGTLLKMITSSAALVVDYSIPTITSVSSAAISVSGSSIIVNVTGAGAIGDKVDVSKLSLFDTTLNKTYQLTNAAGTGSAGVVGSDNTLTINLGSADVLGLTGFGGSTIYMNIAAGSLLIDAAGNVSLEFPLIQTVPVTKAQ